MDGWKESGGLPVGTRRVRRIRKRWEVLPEVQKGLESFLECQDWLGGPPQGWVVSGGPPG